MDGPERVLRVLQACGNAAREVATVIAADSPSCDIPELAGYLAAELFVTCQDVGCTFSEDVELQALAYDDQARWA